MGPSPWRTAGAAGRNECPFAQHQVAAMEIFYDGNAALGSCDGDGYFVFNGGKEYVSPGET